MECEHCKELEKEITSLKKKIGLYTNNMNRTMKDFLDLQKEKKRIEIEYKKLANPINQVKKIKYQAHETLKNRRRELELLKEEENGRTVNNPGDASTAQS